MFPKESRGISQVSQESLLQIFVFFFCLHVVFSAGAYRAGEGRAEEAETDVPGLRENVQVGQQGQGTSDSETRIPRFHQLVFELISPIQWSPLIVINSLIVISPVSV
jgi:hypothetical protein